MTPTAATPAGGMTLERTKVLYLREGQGEYHIVDGKTVTQAQPVYVTRQAGKPPTVRLHAGDHTVTSLTNDELAAVRKTAAKYKWRLIERRADIIVKPAKRWAHLEGDLDCNVVLLDKLEFVARDLGVTILVRSGGRTIEEQWALFNKNMRFSAAQGKWVPKAGMPLTAYPKATAPHVLGIAADCGIDGVNIGQYPGARKALLKHGCTLPVPSESWHVSTGPRSAWASNWLTGI